LILTGVKAEGGRGDDDKVEAVDIEASVLAQCLEAVADVLPSVLCEKDEGRARGVGREAAQRWGA
jgi:hypothetical protein